MKARLRAYAGWRRPLVWWAVLSAATLVLCFVPLFDILGYELALALSVLSSLGAGHVAAAYPQRVRDQLAPFPGARWTLLRLYAVVATLGLAGLVAPLGFASLNALRVRNCDFPEGLAFFALGPVAACLVASAWGLAAGLLAPGRRSASFLWVFGWLSAVGLQLWLVWATPSVRALGTFHGYFSGVLYDESVSIPTGLITLRARDVIVVAAVLSLCSWAVDRSRLRLSWSALRGGRGGAAVASVALLVATAVGFALGPVLGHFRSSSEVARVLGGRTVEGRCVVVHDSALDPELAELVARDCAYGLETVEGFFGARLEDGVTVFLFDTPEQKQELIGAGSTSVAKPWRREVYVQGPAFPHPVLRHEIAHVVAGEFGARPLRVAGRLGGLWPSPGLIEGAAVAADWDEGELTAHEWSRAMHELDIAPPLRDVMGLGFLGVNPSRAYVLAGSFSRWLVETDGPELYRKAYGSGDVAGAYGRPLEDLEAEWLRSLRKAPLRPGDLEVARERFDRPSVFSKVCAHEVAQVRERAALCEATGRREEALTLRSLIVAHTGSSPESRLELARSLVGAGRESRARGLAAAVAGDAEAARGVRRAARILEADLDWTGGRRERALSCYRSLAEEPDTLPMRRLLQVKIAAIESPAAEPHLRRFLLGDEGLEGEPTDLSLLTLSELVAAAPGVGLGPYLLGRQLWSREEHERAIPYLERALEVGLPSWELTAECRRILGISLFRAGRIGDARRAFEVLAATRELPAGLLVEADDWVSRCDWEERRSGGEVTRRGDGRSGRSPPPPRSPGR